MEYFSPKYRRDPNEKVHSLYHGVGPGGTIVTKIVKKASDGSDRMETTRSYEPGLARGEGGHIGTLILGGMETTLDEIEYILAAKKEKKWVPRKDNKEIADMCRVLMERRNDRIRYLQKNPSEKPKRTVRLHLPVGYHMADTVIPGFKILAQV